MVSCDLGGMGERACLLRGCMRSIPHLACLASTRTLACPLAPGFLIRYEDIPVWWRWFSYLNPLRYAWTALMVNQVRHAPAPRGLRRAVLPVCVYCWVCRQVSMCARKAPHTLPPLSSPPVWRAQPKVHWGHHSAAVLWRRGAVRVVRGCFLSVFVCVFKRVWPRGGACNVPAARPKAMQVPPANAPPPPLLPPLPRGNIGCVWVFAVGFFAVCWVVLTYKKYDKR